MEDIIVLNIKYKFGDTEEIIYPVILKDNKEMILVDCGYTGFLPVIEDAMKEKGLDCNQLTKICITHQDHDHMGSLADFKLKYPNIKIVASKIEAPYITGEKKNLRLEQAEAMQSTLSEEEKAFGEAFCEMLRAVKPVKVDILVQDGEIMDWCGGCEIVETPGHTPGHISLYIKNQKTMVTGDAAVLEDDRLVIANPQFTLDLDSANTSFVKLMKYDVETFICYHGGILKSFKNSSLL
ncbi:MBL fold metallo-hydrolase [Anaerocolumna aminovalerica]|uniref:Glyoxylase, beta-lactamase superfamily II n=1 Tax=Anaerocolumna aminovalerica TaxID=1527 RepID=A0A1I5DZW8_9FIRM|nr:MBL fold metallo-hydrolase [Anaerocolumna aminovalerica]SFO04683.1 Glyoxylase, beta-lactamase superfamily II [Anaerocolumna aminovalerica]